MALKNSQNNQNNPYYQAQQQLQSQLNNIQSLLNSGVVVKTRNGQLVNSDGSPVRPDFIEVVDKDGNLKEGQAVEFQQMDPTKLEGYNMLRTMATGAGPTQYGQSQMDLANLQKQQNLDSTAANVNQAQNQALNNLAMRGGAGSGARNMLARQGFKELLAGKQNVNMQNTADLMKINSEDQARKMDLFKNFSDTERQIAAGNLDIANQQTQFNKQLQGYGIENANLNTREAYTAELDKWAAGKQANATRSSGGGGGGCCFIFLEARYGNGTMDEVVRRFRDEHMTERNKRGYYKVSEVLVPLMRKSRAVKALVQVTMTSPLVAYGKAHYGKGSKLGFVFAPLKNFWLKTFDYLGQDHEFIRENGEVV